ncbi:hypothetical protein PF004_g17745 [Phytophthora fragariae]|uniref:Uncharacterized protein n=1 Tax=Phytophthora fragariae TaxID=53985 RepID=A0A6G0NEI1_9STRA|nr:hypothetical protein PF004_g17745 [Phytophthora fragariae]
MTRKTSAADRVKHLKEYDAYHHALLEATIDSGTSKAIAPRSKHCCIRLLNLLFSDLFAVRFASIGDTPTRPLLDTGDIHSGSSFWRDITVEFNTNRTDYNKLISPDVRFDGVDASVIVVHDAGSLCDLWKKCNSNYMKVMACFTKSGEHGDDFFDYCGGAVDVFYLRKCLEIKHDLTSFVEGGLRECDQFDSLDYRERERSSLLEMQSPAPKRRKSDVVETVQGLLASVMPGEPSMVDELMNMHKLIELVGRRIDDVKAKGPDAEALQRYTFFGSTAGQAKFGSNLVARRIKFWIKFFGQNLDQPFLGSNFGSTLGSNLQSSGYTLCFVVKVYNGLLLLSEIHY